MFTKEMAQKKQEGAQTKIPGIRPGSDQPTPQVEKLVDFSFYAPQAYSVNVAGSFNNWTPGAFPLKKDVTGTWRGALRLKPGTYQYRFFMDKRWVDDPNAKTTAANEFGSHNAVLEVK